MTQACKDARVGRAQSLIIDHQSYNFRPSDISVINLNFQRRDELFYITSSKLGIRRDNPDLLGKRQFYDTDFPRNADKTSDQWP
jgi:hypothetical protein